MGKSNLKISDESVRRGTDEEILFQKCVQKFKGYKCTKSTIEEDRYKHIDFWIEGGYSVDVKAHKKVNAKDTEVSQEFTWIEIMNNNGNDGWVNGWATHIAYSFTTHYKMFQRKRLKDFIMSKIDVNNFMIKDTKQPIPYQVYRRPTLLDKVVLVPIKDLVNNVPYIQLKRDANLLNEK